MTLANTQYAEAITKVGGYYNFVTIINRRDGADAVVMSFDHYQSVMETLHLVSSSANAAKLAKAIVQDKAGKAKVRKLLTAD